jgi:anti-anti-sigma factor
MELSRRKEGDISVIIVEGRLDAVTSPEFEREIKAFLNQGEYVLIIDFKDVDYISSAGLRSILAATKQFKEKNGKLCLISLKDAVKEVFDISGFSSIIPIYAKLESALSDIKG